MLPLLELRGITKRFPGVVANDRVDFDVQAGEVHTLFGENGAGKSTLMRVLYGFYKPDEGEIRLRGESVAITSPAAAIARGIGMIHQHFMLVNTLTVAENVALGTRSGRGPLTDLDAVSRRITELSERYGLRVDPKALIWQLSVGERQRVEIIKALYRDVSILILDEPTAVLTPQEVDDLFVVLRQMVADGRGLVFISHKIREVLELSDRITVLRTGRKVGTVLPSEVTRQGLAEMMVGHELPSHEPPGGNGGDARLVVRDLTVKGDRGVDAVRGLGLDVAAARSSGSRASRGTANASSQRRSRGSVQPPTARSTSRERSSSGSTRRRCERLGSASFRKSACATASSRVLGRREFDPDRQWRSTVRTMGFLRARAIRRHSEALVAEFDVKTPSLDTPARNLSGGNIQKLILARELSARPRVLLAAQPTRGVDVGAAHYIHERLMEQRDAGTAILIVSEDLDEVLTISDRVLVMFEGEIIAEAKPRESTREALGLMMAGVRSVA